MDISRRQFFSEIVKPRTLARACTSLKSVKNEILAAAGKATASADEAGITLGRCHVPPPVFAVPGAGDAPKAEAENDAAQLDRKQRLVQQIHELRRTHNGSQS